MNCFVKIILVFRLEFMFKTTLRIMFKTMFKTISIDRALQAGKLQQKILQ